MDMQDQYLRLECLKLAQDAESKSLGVNDLPKKAVVEAVVDRASAYTDFVNGVNEAVDEDYDGDYDDNGDTDAIQDAPAPVEGWDETDA